ncbi:hypothetical protein [Streptomyces yaizuensis]|uniref:DUF4242 domain-containing protein n=1 Tax=Streptomyces yaizuensis TaxID=2989713 RepID=A0ABQ5NVL1_9ACTN|nr:hypothetical protein [Streptomyces sp. YSPA8]GLF94399.1 hypothetical protein SYYSPA8_08900 [Streptomyces sp. YSPA8]
MRNWYFNLVLQDVISEEQSDALAQLAGFHDGRISLVESPERSWFTCSFEAETLTQAVADALARFKDFPGVLVRSVELDEIALEFNDMLTPAVARLPE